MFIDDILESEQVDDDILAEAAEFDASRANRPVTASAKVAAVSPLRLRMDDDDGKCEVCGMAHSAGAWACAIVILDDHKGINTQYGRKSACGLADLIDSKTNAPDLIRQRDALFSALQKLSPILYNSGPLVAAYAEFEAEVETALALCDKESRP